MAEQPTLDSFMKVAPRLLDDAQWVQFIEATRAERAKIGTKAQKESDDE
jgi:hypothetical protein